ncbi:MAG: hypothetical protein VX278_11100 [Myxococcota bacterium]|nr:hypothetical protein [Myxococcota bacterium]
MYRILSVVVLLWAVVFLVFNENPVPPLDVMRQIIWVWSGTFVCVASLMGLGKLTAWGFRSDRIRWDIAMVTGLGSAAVLLLVIVLAGWWSGFTIGALLLLGLACLFVPTVIEWPQIDSYAWILITGTACWTMLDALAPCVDTDALYYHLALAKQISIRGSLIGGFLEPNGSRPMMLHLLYSLSYTLVGEQSPAVLHWLLSLSLLVSVTERSKGGIWAVLFLVSSWSFIQEMGIVSNNLPAAFALFLVFICVEEKKYRFAVVLAFVALSIKLTVIGVLAGIWVFCVSTVKIRMWILVATLLLFSVWPLRNVWDGLHPLFPYMGWDEPFQYVEKYGMGRRIKDMLLLPWNVMMHATPNTHIFQGKLNPIVFVAVFFTFALHKRWIALVCFSLFFWAMGPQWIRHLLMVLPILGYMFARTMVSAPMELRGAVFVCILFGLPGNWGPLLARWSEAWTVVSGQVPREEFQEEHIPGFQALHWADRKLPKDAVLDLFYVWGGSVLNRPYRLSSVEDHIPVRSWIRKHGDDSIDKLNTEFLIVGKPAISYKKYSFLSKEVYEKEFEAPIAKLEELLLKQSVLVYTAKGYRVYRVKKSVDN